jgi:hypothetical protein
LVLPSVRTIPASARSTPNSPRPPTSARSAPAKPASAACSGPPPNPPTAPDPQATARPSCQCPWIQIHIRASGRESFSYFQNTSREMRANPSSGNFTLPPP